MVPSRIIFLFSVLVCGCPAVQLGAGGRPAPVVPTVGAVKSGQYINMFVEAGYSENDVNTRLAGIVNQLLFGVRLLRASFCAKDSFVRNVHIPNLCVCQHADPFPQHRFCVCASQLLSFFDRNVLFSIVYVFIFTGQ